MGRHRSPLRGSVAALAVTAGAVLWAPPSAPAATWTAPLTVGIADPSAPVAEDTAMDASGAVAVVWTSDGDVRATMRGGAGGFGSTVPLGEGATSPPAVALDGAGDGLAVWSRGGTLAAAAGNPAGGGLRAIPDLATDVVGAPDVAFLSTGQALVVWAGTDGAIHALERGPGGAVAPLGLLSTGVGNATPSVAAAGDRAIVAWVTTETAGTTRTTTLRAVIWGTGTGFGAAEEVATETVQYVGTLRDSGTDITSPVAAISASGAADIVATLVKLIALQGDFGLVSTVYTRPPPGGWGPPQDLATFDARLSHAPLTADLVSGRAGDALYVAGEARGPMAFFGNLRGSGFASFGPRVPILAGPGSGEIRAGALGPHRFLTVVRLNGVLESWTQTGAAGFAEPITIIGSGALRLLDADAGADGEGVAVWQDDAGRLEVALYDDAASAGPGPLPAPGVDRTPPVLSGLRVAPSRFAVRRGRGRSARGGATIHWRLSEAATTRLRIQRVRRGVRQGARCVAGRPTSGRARRCTRAVTVRTLIRRARAGPNALPFGGFVRGRPLVAGAYRVTAQATDAALNVSREQRSAFTIVRR